MIGVYFFVNLYIGVIFIKFIISQQKNTHEYLTNDQTKWIEMQKIILYTRPFNYDLPKKGVTFKLLCFYNNAYFKKMIQIALYLNFIYGLLFFSDKSRKNLLAFILFSIIFLIFLLEFIVKIIVFKFYGYFSYFRNRFQFFIIICFFIYLFSKFFKSNYVRFKFKDELTNLLPLFGIFRLLDKFESLKKIFRTLFFSFPVLKSVFFSIFITFFVYSIIGCFFFRNLKMQNKFIDDYINFKNFFYSTMTLLKCNTADNWSILMREIIENFDRKYYFWIELYFVSFIFLNYYLLMNLILMIIFKQFEDFYKNPLNPIQFFKSNINNFKLCWSQYCIKKTENKMSITNIIDFLKFLGHPLGK